MEVKVDTLIENFCAMFFFSEYKGNYIQIHICNRASECQICQLIVKVGLNKVYVLKMQDGDAS